MSTVFLIEDDDDVRKSISWMLRTEGMTVEAFSSAKHALEKIAPDDGGCLLIDLQLPEMDGLALQRRLAEKGCHKPFVLISGHGDVRAAVSAMNQGAVGFLEKPFDGDELIRTVSEALQRDETLQEERRQREDYDRRLADLTEREREILEFVVAGKRTKELARELAISTSTIEVHRSRIMKKMGVETIAQLVRLCVKYDELA